MKRFLLCCVLLIAGSSLQLAALSLIPPNAALPAMKAANGSLPLTIDTFSGAYYDAYSLPDSFLAIFAALFNIRGGVMVDFESRLGKIGGFGGEVGAAYMIVEDDAGNLAFSLLDLPFRLKASLTLKFLKLEAFGGVMFAMGISPVDFAYLPYLDAGGRLGLGPLFLEGSYEFAFGPEYDSFPRFGLGMLLPLSK